MCRSGIVAYNQSDMRQCASSLYTCRLICVYMMHLLADLYSGSRSCCYSPSQIHQWQVLCPRVPGGKLSPAPPTGISPQRYISALSPCRQSAIMTSHLLSHVAHIKLLVPCTLGCYVFMKCHVSLRFCLLMHCVQLARIQNKVTHVSCMSHA